MSFQTSRGWTNRRSLVFRPTTRGERDLCSYAIIDDTRSWPSKSHFVYSLATSASSANQRTVTRARGPNDQQMGKPSHWIAAKSSCSGKAKSRHEPCAPADKMTTIKGQHTPQQIADTAKRYDRGIGKREGISTNVIHRTHGMSSRTSFTGQPVPKAVTQSTVTVPTDGWIKIT